MKFARIAAILFFLFAVFISCKKKEYPESVTDNESIFYFKALINNAPVSLEAGKAGYYMYSSFAQDSNKVYNFIGNLKRAGCQANCANSVRIYINDVKVSAPNAPTLIDSALGRQTYDFAYDQPQGYDVAFQPSYNKTATSYLWDFGDGSTSTLPNPVHPYAKSGKYNVCLTISGPSGNSLCYSSICNTQKIGLPGNPCVTSIGVNTILGDSVFFTQTSSGQGPLQYLWSFGNGIGSTSPNPMYTYPTTGSYAVTLRVRDAAGDEAIAMYNVITKKDGSSCAANYRITNIIPIIPTVNLNLSKINIVWTDANGVEYSTRGVIQPASSYFQILSVEGYKANENGQTTRKIHVKFKCNASNGSNTIGIDNGEAVIAVAYQ